MGDIAMDETNQRLAASLEQWDAHLQATFTKDNPHSLSRFEQACHSMPGGNTRSALHFEPFPLTMARGEGAHLTDLDGHTYVDFIGDHTAGLFGHSDPTIAAAMHEAIDAGMTLGTPNAFDVELSALICQRFDSVERVRFTNSGTEANLMAITVAREHTGRTKILVFRGGYHGGVLLFGGANRERNAPYPFVVAEYNNQSITEALIDEHADELAAVLIEPMMGTGGAIVAEPGFLRWLRQRCTEIGAVLIFDEVMTSRLSAGGLQGHWNITPDMTTFGKYIGGGATFGAFGGSTAIMDRFDPRRADAIAHAGTFNNNIVTMAAGVAALRDVYTVERAREHTSRGEAFKERLNQVAASHDVPVQVTGIGSILHVHWQRGPVRSPADLQPVPAVLKRCFHLDMLGQGYYFSQKGFLTLSLPLTDSHYQGFVRAFDQSLERIAARVVQENVLPAK